MSNTVHPGNYSLVWHSTGLYLTNTEGSDGAAGHLRMLPLLEDGTRRQTWTIERAPCGDLTINSAYERAGRFRQLLHEDGSAESTAVRLGLGFGDDPSRRWNLARGYPGCIRAVSAAGRHLWVDQGSYLGAALNHQPAWQWELIPLDGDQPADEASPYADVVLEDDPCVYWRFKDPSGFTVFDSSCHGCDGALMGGITLGQEGPFAGSGAALFDGRSGYVWCSGDHHLSGPELTFEAWVNGKEIGALLGSQPGETFVHLSLSPSSRSGSCAFSDQGKIALPSISNGPAGAFRHVVLVLSPGACSMYVDGRKVGSSAPAYSALMTPEKLLLGMDTLSGWSAFSGLLSEVAIYDHALTEERVMAHMNAARELGFGAGGQGTELQLPGGEYAELVYERAAKASLRKRSGHRAR